MAFFHRVLLEVAMSKTHRENTQKDMYLLSIVPMQLYHYAYAITVLELGGQE